MLQFFKKIRRGLITNNKFSKYVLYALGEIFLVMIGILLALQVNNWNEQKKLKVREQTILNNLKSDLQSSLHELDICTKKEEKQIRNLESLLISLEADTLIEEAIDSTLTFIYFTTPYLKYTSYESLKSSGTEVISNKEILSLMAEIYEYDLAYTIKDYDRIGWESFSHIHMPYFTKHIRANVHDRTAKPNDYEQLRIDPEFRNIINLSLRHRYWSLKSFKKASQHMDSLVTMINAELEKM